MSVISGERHPSPAIMKRAVRARPCVSSRCLYARVPSRDIVCTMPEATITSTPVANFRIAHKNASVTRALNTLTHTRTPARTHVRSRGGGDNSRCCNRLRAGTDDDDDDDAGLLFTIILMQYTPRPPRLSGRERVC